jgi:Flp pilus assembly secretin CpaC
VKIPHRHPLLLHTKADVYRTFTVDPTVCEVVRITNQDISLTGRSVGSTHVTFFTEDPTQPMVTYLVEVTKGEGP